MRRPLAALLTVTALVASLGLVAPTASARGLPDTVALPDGFQPEGITSGPGTTFYVGSLADGAIYRGDLRTGRGSVLVPGSPGAVSVGIEYDRRTGRLWVAGGPTGQVRAHDARTGELLGSWAPGGTGFLNDLTVTRDAVYVTDSQVQQLVVVPTPRGDLGSPATRLPLTGDLQYVEGFNANGIEDARGGRVLVVVQSATGWLFTVDPVTGETTRVDLGGASLTNGDGLLLRGSTLYVVRNRLNEVAEVRLRLHGTQPTGRVVRTLTDPDFDVPTTITRAAGRLWAVNARFGTPPTPTTTYDVVLVDGR
ncbi:NHL repeat-containing protein [Thalassiella azotivora]